MPRITTTTKPDPLSATQLRVLACLSTARGPISKTTIAERCGYYAAVHVGTALGFSDPDKRRAYEAKDGKASLLTRGFVTEVMTEVEEGITEAGYRITDAGRKALATA